MSKLMNIVKALAFLLSASMLRGQTPSAVNATSGYTPSVMAPGTPAGSYFLSGFDTVNYGSGLINFRFPLANIGGRGKISSPVYVNGFNPMWVVQAAPVMASNGGGSYLNGWSYSVFNAPYYTPTSYGGGVMFQRTAALNCTSAPQTPQNYNWAHAITRLTFVGPDGTETEFVDQQTGGMPEPGSWNSPFSRGTVFLSRDGSSSVFTSTTPITDSNACTAQGTPGVTGSLVLHDGTKYTITNGSVTMMEDANGNEITFAPPNANGNLVMTDPLGRTYTLNASSLTYYGSGGTTRTINIVRDSLSNALRPGQSLERISQLWAIESCQADGQIVACNDSPYNPQIIRQIDLPDGSSYSFEYNSYGNVARVVLPTGGAVEYDYNGYSGAGGSGSPYTYVLTLPISQRREYLHATDTSPYRVDMFSPSSSGNYAGTVSHYDGDGNLLAKEIHTVWVNLGGPGPDPTADNDWQDGRDTEVKYYASDGATVLRDIVNNYQQRSCANDAPPCWFLQSTVSWSGNYSTSVNGPTAPPHDPQLISQVTTEGSMVKQTTFGYDSYNNQTDQWDYTWGSGSPGSLLRHTNTAYIATSSYIARNILNLPSNVAIENASGAWGSNRVFYYDEQPLQDTPSIYGHDPADETIQTIRGNVTTDQSWWAINGTFQSYPADHYTYDIAGNVLTHQDPNNNTTTYSYSDATYAHPIAITLPSVNGIQQTTSIQYDFSTGKPIEVTDPNGVSTVYTYNDPLDRLTLIQSAAGTAQETRTSYSYASPTQLDTYADQNATGDGALHNTAIYDGFGRQSESRQYESSSGYIATDTTYDPLGRILTTTNPSRPGDNLNYATTYSYDALGRVTQVQTADGSVTATSYSGNQTTVIDPAGVSRTTVVDGLGRLTTVTDATGTTSYGYDLLDDLTSVSQGSQTRTFTYDSLKRLVTAVNPESGITSYSYDAAGNLTAKTDNRGITTSYYYDALNRLTMKGYSDQGQTPWPSYTYDSSNVPFSKGRLTQVNNGVAITTYTVYDPLGRITQSNEQIVGQMYLFTYGYNSAGSLISETYPSGRVIDFAYDGANRQAAVSGTYAGQSKNYVTNVNYWPHGAVYYYALGNNLWPVFSYNSRLQMSQFYGAVNNNPSNYLYVTNLNWGSTNNNGNLQSVQSLTGNQVPYASLTGFTDSFTYDGANRLSTASEPSGWSRSYGYDQYGNMWVTGWSGPGLSGLTATAASAYNTSNNRLAASQYDAAGNQTSAGSYALAYDAENRQISQTNTVGNPSATYAYDGEGRRVEKIVGATTTIYVYDGLGQLAAEYSSAVQTAPCVTCYLTYDHLGSTRMVTDQNANVISRHDYLPFGEEIPSGTGGRSILFGSTADNVNQKFTAKERDGESGLDYFGARYYGGALGRFTSVDPDNAGSDPSNPQSWNAYSYVLNSPLSNTDPDGEDTCKDGSYADACVTDTPPDPIQTVPFPQGPPQQPPTTNPAPVQPGPAVNPGGNMGNCVAGFTAAGAGVGGAAGYWAGGGAGALGGGAVGTAVEPGGGTAVGAFGGFQLGSGVGAAGGFALGGRAGYLLGSIVCASSGGGAAPGTGGGTSGNSPARQNKINHIFGKAAHNLQILVQKFGSQEAAYDALEVAAQQQVKGSGVFEQVVDVNGVNVTVRGNVINGVVNIGTAFR